MISYLFPIGSVSQLCRNRLEDITYLPNTILVSIIVQVHEFHEKSLKVEKDKALNHYKQEKVTNKAM